MDKLDSGMDEPLLYIAFISTSNLYAFALDDIVLNLRPEPRVQYFEREDRTLPRPKKINH